MKHLHIVGMAASLCLMVMAAAVLGVVDAQVKAKFTDRLSVVNVMAADPNKAANAVEAVCTQEQLDAIQAAIKPVLSNAEKVRTLEEVKARLESLGETDAVTAVAAAITVAAERVEAVTP